MGRRFSYIYTDNIFIHKFEDLKLPRSSVSKKEMLLLSVYTCPLVPRVAGGSVQICVPTNLIWRLCQKEQFLLCAK